MVCTTAGFWDVWFSLRHTLIRTAILSKGSPERNMTYYSDNHSASFIPSPCINAPRKISQAIHHEIKNRYLKGKQIQRGVT